MLAAISFRGSYTCLSLNCCPIDISVRTKTDNSNFCHYTVQIQTTYVPMCRNGTTARVVRGRGYTQQSFRHKMYCCAPRPRVLGARPLTFAIISPSSVLETLDTPGWMMSTTCCIFTKTNSRWTRINRVKKQRAKLVQASCRAFGFGDELHYSSTASSNFVKRTTVVTYERNPHHNTLLALLAIEHMILNANISSARSRHCSKLPYIPAIDGHSKAQAWRRNPPFERPSRQENNVSRATCCMMEGRRLSRWPTYKATASQLHSLQMETMVYGSSGIILGTGNFDPLRLRTQTNICRIS